jgi:hypothetical protein
VEEAKPESTCVSDFWQITHSHVCFLSATSTARWRRGESVYRISITTAGHPLFFRADKLVLLAHEIHFNATVVAADVTK